MTQTSNRLYDRFARLMNDAASVASGVRREATTMFRSQAERIATDIDLVRREDFETVKEMARLAREENAKLGERVAKLEAQLGSGGASRGRTTRAGNATAATKSRAATPAADKTPQDKDLS
jgi:BMFP domain-containing protein YqiC